MMHDYKMSFLDKLDFIVTQRDFSGPDDLSALDHAHTLCRTHKIEISQAGRFVARVFKGATARNANAHATT